MKDVELQISTCQHRWDLTYKFEKMPWSLLADRLAQTKRTAETVAEYKAMSKDDQSAIKDVGGFVLGDLQDGQRSKRTVLSRSAITLDLDFAPASFWADFTMLFSWSAVLYSTHKHTAKTPKYRLIIPLARPVDGDAYEAIARRIASDYMDIDWCDDTTFQPSRMMFWPSTSRDGEYVYERLDGDILDPDEILEAYEGRWNDISRWAYSSRVARKRDSVPTGKAADPTSKPGVVGWFCKAYTIQDAIRTYLPDVYEPTDKDDRWTYTGGSTAGGLVIYDGDTLAYSNHATDPCGDMHCVNAFDMVRIHKFRDLDKDSKGVGINLPSYKAMAELVAQDQRVQQVQAEEMFAAQVDRLEEDATGISREDFARLNRAWQGKLTRNAKTGRIEDTIDNVVTILTNDVKLQGFGGLNEFTGVPEKCGSLPWWRYDPLAKEWKDADLSELARYIEKYYGIRNERICKHAWTIVFQMNAFHPVRDYLDGLEWDGVERLDTLLIDYLGAQDNIYVREVTRKTITAAVARVYEPGCKFDYVLTLAGPQGCGKSQIIRILASDDWVNDSLQTFTGKEAYECVMGSWFVEIAELAANKRSEVEQAKQFISKQADKFRKAYATLGGIYRRQCVFIGTTNSSDFLRDMTGNRRWWVVDVKPSTKKDIFTDLPRERDQIFAEAKARYQQGEELRLKDEVEQMAAEIQEEYRYQSVKEDLIANYLDLDLPDGWQDMALTARQFWLSSQDKPGTHKRDKVCLLELWQEIFNGSRGNFPNADQREISDILFKLGWIRLPNKVQFGKEYGKQRGFARPFSSEISRTQCGSGEGETSA